MGQTPSSEGMLGEGYRKLPTSFRGCGNYQRVHYQSGKTYFVGSHIPLDTRSPQGMLEISRYYSSRQSLQLPHLIKLQQADLIDSRTNSSITQTLKSRTDVNTICSLGLLEQYCGKGMVQGTIRLRTMQYYFRKTLQEEIERRKVHKNPFKEEELWDLLAVGAEVGKAMILSGFKEPLLSPVAIKISSNNQYYIGEWQFSHFFEVNQTEQEESQFYEQGQTFLHPKTSRVKVNPAKSASSYNILTNYYWPPEGASAVQATTYLGKKATSISITLPNSQIFSLAMTILHLCLMRPLYQSQTFSQKKILSHLNDAISQRISEKQPLSQNLIKILQRMLAWDSTERIGYEELEKNIQMRKSSRAVSILTTQIEEPCENSSFYLKKSFESSLTEGSGSVRQGSGDCDHPLEESQKLIYSSSQGCLMPLDCNTNYMKIDYTIRRERKEWQRFQNRIQQSSYKVHQHLQQISKTETSNCSKQLFKSHNTFSFPAQSLLQDGEDIPNDQFLTKICPNDLERQFIDIEAEPTFEIDCGNSVENSLKLLDYSHIKAYDETHQISKQRQSINNQHQSDFSIDQLFGTRTKNESLKDQSLLLKSSVAQPRVYQSQENLFTSPQLMELIRSAAVTNPAKSKQPSLSTSQYVKESFAKGYYEGGKAGGQRSGYGTFYYNEGGKYCGDWLANQMHGKGTLYYSDGRIAYQGDWRNDSLHGRGILYNENPVSTERPYDYSSFDASEQCWVYYEGSFQKDDKSGNGVLMLTNGQKFQGSFKGDLVHGRGVFYCRNGKKVIGEWSQNRLVRVLKEESI